MSSWLLWGRQSASNEVINSVPAGNPSKQRKVRVTARDLTRSKNATRQNAAIRPLSVAETKKKAKAEGTQYNYVNYLRRFAEFLRDREPNAIDGEFDETLRCFVFPIPEHAINSFLEVLCFVTVDGYTVLRKGSTPTGFWSALVFLFKTRKVDMPSYLRAEYKEFYTGFKNYSATVDAVIGKDVEGRESLQRKGVIFIQKLALKRDYTSRSQDDYVPLVGSGSTNVGCRIQFLTHISLANIGWKVSAIFGTSICIFKV